MQEQLLKNSHEIYIGQKVRIMDKDVLDLYDQLMKDKVKERPLYGEIVDIDGEDIRVDVEVFYNEEGDRTNLGGWNINFSTKC